MKRELELVAKAGTYPALARWADRWRVKFSGTGNYAECLKQAWEAVSRHEGRLSCAKG